MKNADYELWHWQFGCFSCLQSSYGSVKYSSHEKTFETQGDWNIAYKGSVSSLDECITRIVNKEHPQTVKQLVELVCQEHQLPQQIIIERIMYLQKQGRLSFRKTPAPAPLALRDYLLSSYSYWYWIIIVLALATTISVFTISEDAYPIVYASYVLGSIFVLGLPGYSLIKVLFPTKELDNIERAALSIGASMILVPVTGLLLSYTPWGMRTAPFIFSLLGLTTAIATVAIIRERKAKLKESQLPRNDIDIN